MSLDAKEFIRQIAVDMAENMRACDCKNNMIIVKHYNSLFVEKKDAVNISEELKGYKVIYHHFDNSDIIGAYEPFLDFIRDEVERRKLDIENFVQNADVYYMQKNVFLAYLKREPVSRNEEYIINEIKYEKKRMQDSIVKMIQILCENNPTIFMFNKLHRAGKSTICIIQKIVEAVSDIGIIATVNDFVEIERYMSDEWNKLLNYENACGNIREWGFNTIIPEKIRSGRFTLKSGYMEKYLEQLELMYCTLAFDQADKYVKMISFQLSDNSDIISETLKLKLFEIFAKIEIELDNTADCMVACEMYDKVLQEFPSAAKKFMYYYLMVKALVNKKHNADTDENLQKCLLEAEKSGSDFLVFKAKMLEHMVEYNGWREVWLNDDIEDVSDELIENTVKYNYVNHLAHMYIFAKDRNINALKSIDGIEERLKEFNKGIELATKIDNKKLLLSAYKRKLIISSASGFFDTAEYFVNKKIVPLINVMDEKIEKGNIFNSMGYNYCATEKYDKAQECFFNALDIFLDDMRIEYLEETLYNIAINDIMAQNYVNAEKVLLTVMEIMSVIHSESIRVAHISKIYGLLAFVQYKNGKNYDCYLSVNYAEQFLKTIIRDERSLMLQTYWEDDLFLYHICKGMLACGEKRYVEAEKEYEKAYRFTEPQKGGAAFFYIIYAKEMNKLLNILNRKEEAEAMLVKCRDYYRDGGYAFREKELNAILDENSDTYESQIELEAISDKVWSKINKAIRECSIKLELEKKQKRLDYLNVWQKVETAVEVQIEYYTYCAMLSLCDEFELDRMLLVIKEKDMFRVKYSNFEKQFEVETIEKLAKYFNTHRGAFSASKTNKNFYEYEKVAEIFNEKYLCSIAGIPIVRKNELEGFAVGIKLLSDNWGNATKSIIIDMEETHYLEYMIGEVYRTIKGL